MTSRWPLVTTGGRIRELPAGDVLIGGLVQVASATVGETVAVSVNLGVKRYAVSAPGTLVTDRIIAALTGVPVNGTLQDAYVSAAGTISVGILAPALGVGAIISVPLALYKIG